LFKERGNYGRDENEYKILVGKLEGNRPLGTPRHSSEDNIGMHFGKKDRKLWTLFIWLE
jgi:hypothetical protein